MLLTIKGTIPIKDNQSSKEQTTTRNYCTTHPPFGFQVLLSQKVQMQGTVFAVLIETSHFYDQYKHTSWWVLKKVQENLSPRGRSWPVKVASSHTHHCQDSSYLTQCIIEKLHLPLRCQKFLGSKVKDKYAIYSKDPMWYGDSNLSLFLKNRDCSTPRWVWTPLCICNDTK